MRLAIDATPILPGGKGLAIVFESLLDCLSRSRVLKPTAVYVDESFFDEARRRWSGMSLKPVRSRPALVWEKVFLSRHLRKDGIDLLLTGRDRTVCEPMCKTVVYLFEVPDYRNEATLSSKDGWYAKAAALLTRFFFTSVVRGVTHFIVSSEFTKQDLVARYGVSAEKITVVYPGLRPQFCSLESFGSRAEARRHFADGQPYVLHFATGDPRDNTSTAIEAFARALPNLNHDVVLLLVGTGAKAVIEKDVTRYGLGDRVRHTGFLSVEDLVLSYLGAEAYLDPTLYEGFGLQLLEAMACGVPVLSSRVTSVPEVVGDAGMLFDPHDVDGFASGLVRVVNEPDLRKFMISGGLERAKQFTWERTIPQLVSTFENIARQDGT